MVDEASAAVRDLIARVRADDPMRPNLERVQETVARLAVLAGALDPAMQRRTPRATPLDLNSVVRQLSSSLQRILGPFITLETALHTPGLWAATDRSRLEQIALGLVINAREALPLGGTVRLATREWIIDRPTEFRIGALPPGTWAVLEVHDNGAGVDDRSSRFLLDHDSQTVAFDSTLSLATVSAAVSEAGGHIVLDMPRLGGTTLAACFPAVLPPRARQPATGVASAVLIVDHDEWSRTSAARTLRHAGFGVLEAGHADDALELLDDVAGSCVRLVLIDHGQLTGGLRPLGERIRRERPEIDVLITATHRASTGAQAEGPILTKPFSPEDLLRAVRERFLLSA